MPRSKRPNIINGWYHVFNRGISRKTICFTNYHFSIFQHLLFELKSNYNIETLYLIHLSRYIHLNPLEANLIQAAENYPWSSCRFFLDSNLPIHPSVKKDTILSFFKTQNEYRNFLNLGNSNKLSAFYNKKRIPTISRLLLRQEPKRKNRLNNPRNQRLSIFTVISFTCPSKRI